MFLELWAQYKAQLKELQTCELLDMKQWALVKWLTLEDQGISFFAKAVKVRHVKNSLMRTMDTHGWQTSSLREMKRRAVEYFSNLFTYEPTSPPLLNLNISFHDSIFGEMAAWLRHFSTMEEVKGSYIIC